MNKYYWQVASGLALVTLISAVVCYPLMPDQVPIHWNIRGEVDGWGTRRWAFVTPAAIAGMLLLFRMLPWLSPQNYRLESFQKTYDYIVLVVVAMFSYVHVLLLLAFTGVFVNNSRLLVAGLFLGFAAMGRALGQVRRNFYVGVRTPWTLASERVWNDTHRFAAWAFVAAGLAGCISALIGLPLWLPIVFILPAGLGPIVYSLVHYKRLERRGEL